jgi:hypothetical protein
MRESMSGRRVKSRRAGGGEGGRREARGARGGSHIARGDREGVRM